MKYLLVADETGNPIYYDHPDGQMLSLVMATSFVHMKTNFESICRGLSCGKTRFVIHQYETLVFLLVSDQGEPDSVLRSQLHLVYQLILLLFGPNNLHQRRRSLDRVKKTIQRLIDTNFHLLNTNQSVLVQSIELLEVNKDILNRCMHNLRGVVANCPGATHALLFVGTKLLAWFFRPKSFQLSSMDMFLLILYFRGAFHPVVRELEFTKIQVADYTDHEEVIREATRQGSASSLLPTDTDISGATELDDGVSVDDAFDTDWDTESFTLDGPATLDVGNPVLLLQGGWLDEVFDPHAPQQQAVTDTSSNSSSDIPMNLTQSIRVEAAQGILEQMRAGLKDGQTNEAVIVLHHALHALNLVPTPTIDGGSIGLATKQALRDFQTNQGLRVTGEADIATISMLIRAVRTGATSPDPADRLSADKLAALDRGRLDRERSRGQLNSRSHRASGYGLGSSSGSLPKQSGVTSVSPRAPISQAGGNPATPRSPNSNDDSASSSPASSRPASRAEDSTPTPPRATPAEPAHQDSVFEQVYLRIPTHNPVWVYCSELQEITTLVVISKGLTGSKEERDRLDKARDQMRAWLQKTYAAYLLAKERTHLPILPHLPHLPGLVHYIFVDRTTNRVRAPTISPLHGQVHRDPVATERMLERLRKEVRGLVHTAQDHLAQGFTAMLVRKKEFLYSYRLWVEDDEGVEQVIEQNIPTNENLHKTPLGHRFYKELLRWLFPSQSQQMKCYELYTLYLGILPAALVSKNDRALIATLLERDVD